MSISNSSKLEQYEVTKFDKVLISSKKNIVSSIDNALHDTGFISLNINVFYTSNNTYICSFILHNHGITNMIFEYTIKTALSKNTINTLFKNQFISFVHSLGYYIDDKMVIYNNFKKMVFSKFGLFDGSELTVELQVFAILLLFPLPAFIIYARFLASPLYIKFIIFFSPLFLPFIIKLLQLIYSIIYSVHVNNSYEAFDESIKYAVTDSELDKWLHS